MQDIELTLNPLRLMVVDTPPKRAFEPDAPAMGFFLAAGSGVVPVNLIVKSTDRFSTLQLSARVPAPEERRRSWGVADVLRRRMRPSYGACTPPLAPLRDFAMTPAEVVNLQLAAYNRRDVVAFVATYAEDACIYEMPHAKLVFRGRTQIAEHYGNKTFKREGLRADLLGRSVVGNKVFDHEQSWGSPSGPTEVIALYEVNGDLITAVWFYEIAGVSEPPAH